MKTLKTLTAAVLLMVSISSFAAGEPGNEKMNMNYALNTYIQAIANGKVNGFSEVLDRDVKFTVTGGKKVINYNKSEMVTFAKRNENMQQNCTTEYKIVELNDAQALVKVTMKYPDFTKVNLVSMANTSEGWKITNVTSSF